MKKVFLFLASAMICAAMAACGGNNEEKSDSPAVDTPNVEAQVNNDVNNDANNDVNADARQNAIMAAAQRICDCGDVDKCIDEAIDQTADGIEKDEDFKKAVRNEAMKCLANKGVNKVKEEAKEQTKAAAKEAGKAAAEDLKKNFGKK
ncbi:MAG: hypothetical protein K6D59_11175 [Bacteroidales bacterium]|nr:hypothetical protein [Bacteroidales bacterium]